MERNSLQRDDLDLLIAKDGQKAFNPFRQSCVEYVCSRKTLIDQNTEGSLSKGMKLFIKGCGIVVLAVRLCMTHKNFAQRVVILPLHGFSPVC